MLKHKTQLSIADYPNCLKGESRQNIIMAKTFYGFLGLEKNIILLDVDLWIKLAFKKE